MRNKKRVSSGEWHGLSKYFMGVPKDLSTPKSASAWVIPIPYEETVSYGGGTGKGPEAILTASRQVEWYDQEFDAEPILHYGGALLPTIRKDPCGPESMTRRIEQTVAKLAAEAAAQEKFLLFLGGEHSIAAGIARGLHKVWKDLAVVQVDAHADLREDYRGSRFSHACAMARIVDQGIPVAGVGIRNWSVVEAAWLKRDGGRLYKLIPPAVIHAGARWHDSLFKFIGDRPVYLTFDVDGLDPSIMPNTGTPEPDGLGWREALSLLKALCRRTHVVAADFNELAPVPKQHAADFLTAKLIYKLLTYRLYAEK